MKQNKKYFGNAVQAILDTAIEKYCVGGDEDIEIIFNLLNVADDMACMWDLWETLKVCKMYDRINELLISDNSKYRILKEGCKHKLVRFV